jgi:hypothetical protein
VWLVGLVAVLVAVLVVWLGGLVAKGFSFHTCTESTNSSKQNKLLANSARPSKRYRGERGVPPSLLTGASKLV